MVAVGLFSVFGFVFGVFWIYLCFGCFNWSFALYCLTDPVDGLSLSKKLRTYHNFICVAICVDEFVLECLEVYKRGCSIFALVFFF